MLLKNKKIILLLVLFSGLLHPGLFSQRKNAVMSSRPRLIVGIVIDQMRQEYLYRFRHRFGKSGFMRFLEQGLQFTDARFNYVPTFTGPGHASIFTGATPRQHGIVANDWYLRNSKKTVYCVEDPNASSVPEGFREGKKSPRFLKCTTLSDELKLRHASSKVISVSLKDRSAILPAGHQADGVFWMDDSSGLFISSDFYLPRLPEWVVRYNTRLPEKIKKFAENGWKLLYPPDTYTASAADDFPFEKSPFSQKTVFPYSFDVSAFRRSWIKSLPLGNTMVRELAAQAVIHEKLGMDSVPDLLLISFSSTDYIGHYFGPRSVETEDTYLRLDRELDSLFSLLDRHCGKNNYVVFMTSDHGCSENVEFMRKHKIPAGTLQEHVLEDSLRTFFRREFGKPEWLEKVSNFLIFFSSSVEEKRKSEITEKTRSYLLNMKGIASVNTIEELNQYCPGNIYPEQLNQAGYHPSIQAHLIYYPEPGWLDYGNTGTTHGVCYSGDTHVPLLWWGSGIARGTVHRKIFITQIAPTLSILLGIPFPSCAFHEVIQEVIEKP